ncbi:MAG: metallophosphoesterase, partial [Chitinispirillia bacterium]
MNEIIRKSREIIFELLFFSYAFLNGEENYSYFAIPCYISNVTTTSADINWEWRRPEKSFLVYGTSLLYTDTLICDSSKNGYVHLKNLKEHTKYYYSIVVNNKAVFQDQEGYFFYTAPEDTRESVIFAVIGDTRTDDESFISDHKATIESIRNHTFPQFLIHLGDMINNTNPKPWQDFFTIESSLLKNCSFHPVRGLSDGTTEQFVERFLKPGTHSWYSFSHGPVYCIILDIPSDKSTDYYIKNIGCESEQYRWLMKQLQSDRRKNHPFTVVAFFTPLFSPLGKSDKYLLSLLPPLFSKNNVDLVLNGSDHCLSYAQYKNVSFIITGGGGAALQRFHKKKPAHVILTEYLFHHLRISIHFPTMYINAIDNRGI